MGSHSDSELLRLRHRALEAREEDLGANSLKTYLLGIMLDPAPRLSTQTPPFLRRWPWIRIIMDHREWMPPVCPVYLCLRAPPPDHSRRGATPGSRFVCVSNVEAEMVAPPPPSRRKRRPPPETKVVAYVCCPTFRNWSVESLEAECSAQRGVSKRLQKMLQEAVARGMLMRVSEALLDEDNVYFDRDFSDYLHQNQAMKLSVRVF